MMLSRVLRFHLDQVAGHTRAFHLEDACGLSAPIEFETLRVIHRDVVEREFHAVTVFDHVAGARHDRQRGQAEEVHLEHAQAVEDAHFELGDRLDGSYFRAGGGAVQRKVVQQRLIGNHHARRMGAGIAHRAFHVNGGVNQLAHGFVGVVGRLQVGDFLECVAQVHRFAGDVRHELGHPVHFGDGDVHHAGHVAQRATRRHGAEGDDLRHLVVAVLAGGVCQHFGTAVVAEVEVDVRHGHAPGVEEAFEDESVLDGVHQRDLEGVRHDGAGCRPARVVPDALFAREAAQVPHDQEVGVKAHVVDDLELVIQPLADVRRGGPVAVAMTRTFFAQYAQVGAGRVTFWHGELGQVVTLEAQVHLAAFGDGHGVRKRLGDFREQRGHLLR